MNRLPVCLLACGLTVAVVARAGEPAASGHWRVDAPGLIHRVTPADMPAPYATRPSINPPRPIARPEGMVPLAPRGFDVTLFASGLTTPRTMRFAPNGDLFVAESSAGRIAVLRPGARPGAPMQRSVFASGLDMPYGIAFWPPGPNPTYVYVGNWDSVVRFPYHAGDTVASGPAQPVIASLPTEGHWTRDVAFSPDGSKLYVAVGSLSNDAEDMPRWTQARIHAWEATHGVGAAWGDEAGRAVVLVTDPEGRHVGTYATGLRNCVSLAIQPDTGTPWCTVNERDQRGDDLVPDFVTPVRAGGFYGWPWFYIGDHEDPAHKGERPDLAGKVITPPLLLQAHSAPLGLTFYEANQFPPEYRGSIFVALHGSYNRSQLTGYKVVRVLMKDGKPTGSYEDFLTGFVVNEKSAWGRPVGVTVTPDGSLLVSEDFGGTIWQVTYQHPPARQARSTAPAASMRQ